MQPIIKHRPRHFCLHLLILGCPKKKLWILKHVDVINVVVVPSQLTIFLLTSLDYTQII